MLKTNLFIFSIIFISIFIFFLSFKADSNPEYDFCLKNSYEDYKKNFMSNDGRIMDPERDNNTTSEGQSYIMLRSIISKDKETFELSYKWAKNNLQRKDKLFAWLWGRNPNGKYEILDYNSASDADIDIAFALILAYENWNESKYLEEAIPIINSIWNNETKRIGNYLILMPGVVQTNSDKIEINPSYFSPYAFRYFQKYDDIHDWNCLIDSSYYYLDAVMSKTETGLPPNWFLIENNEENNVQKIVLEDSSRSDFSYDAIRVFARIYLDYIETGEKRALPVLEKSKIFIAKWEQEKNFYVHYKANGQVRDKDKVIGSIAILIPAIEMYNSEIAAEIYKKEAEPYLKNQKYMDPKRDYYGKNLLWFGCYLYKEMDKRRIKNINSK